MYYDFAKFGYEGSNFIVHPEDWYMAAKISKDNLWRVTYGDVPGLTKEEYVERLPARYREILPGQPEPSAYKVTNVGPYKMHQIWPSLYEWGGFSSPATPPIFVTPCTQYPTSPEQPSLVLTGLTLAAVSD
jgi:hypothetical protein